MTHYTVLGIPEDADDRVIRSAFRALVRRYHPDAGEGSSPERFRRLVEAYETLTDPVRRQAYDRSLRTGPRLEVRAEPMMRPAEPLAPWSSRAEPGYAVRVPRWATPGPDDWLDRVWRAMEDEFFRAFRAYRRPFQDP